ncbi:NAD(P)H-dependent oxidoreductase [Actinoplanes sp. G11-F43]|uniref:NAD(P)H-dependent oxidoreductase n=1 Tax=Actinoplanes sp. G11-F43 TaxID=3424130 RepID=UPI003D354381
MNCSPSPHGDNPSQQRTRLLPGVDPTAPAPAEARELLDRLGMELLEADAYLFAVPLYDWNVPSQLKTWLDLILNHPRLGVHGDWPLKGRPAVLALSRGGGYGPAPRRRAGTTPPPTCAEFWPRSSAWTCTSPKQNRPTHSGIRKWRRCEGWPRSR